MNTNSCYKLFKWDKVQFWVDVIINSISVSQEVILLITNYKCMIIETLDLSQVRFMNINNCKANLLMNIRLRQKYRKEKEWYPHVKPKRVHDARNMICCFYTNHYHGKTFCIRKKFNPKHAVNMKSTFSDLIYHSIFTHCNPCLFFNYCIFCNILFNAKMYY